MTRHPRRTPQTIPASVAAVIHLATEAQLALGRPMPPTELCELLTQAQELEFQHLLQCSSTPTLASIRYTPAAYATMRGLTPQAAEIITDMARHLTGT